MPPAFTSDSVTVDDAGVHVSNYYFPVWFVRKTLPFSRIERVEVVSCGVCTSKDWGMALTPVWWNLDMGAARGEGGYPIRRGPN